VKGRALALAATVISGVGHEHEHARKTKSKYLERHQRGERGFRVVEGILGYLQQTW
jgi:hypothetical protein